jgi:DME family drug/metabolite transporter
VTALHAGAGTSRHRAYREMTIAGVLWGTIGPAAAIVDEHTSLSPLQTSFWRLAIAVVPLGLLAILAARATARPTRTLLLFGLAVGALTGASQLAYFAAVADSGIAIPTLIANGHGPILTAVGQTVVFRERPDGRTLASMAAALTGLALLVLDGPPAAPAFRTPRWAGRAPTPGAGGLGARQRAVLQRRSRVAVDTHHDPYAA